MIIPTVIVNGIIFLLAVLLAWPLGRYMSNVYQEQRSLLDLFQPMEERIYRICKVNAKAEMNWKQYLSAFLVINAVWLIWAILLLLFQGQLWLNPAHNPSMSWSLALNSAVSFLTSTNLQHYSGETGATYLTQLAVFTFLQFVSAASSLCAGLAVVRGLSRTSVSGPGNFYKDFVRSFTRILLPLCLIAGTLFAFRGVPATLKGPYAIHSLQGDSLQVATGPAAVMLPIKELGSNGGGFFGANDAHPFENPDFFTFVLHCICVLLLPMAFVYFIGYYLKNRKFSRMMFAVMTAGLLIITIPIICQEIKGNPAVAAMGINNSSGNMEGKEVRLGSVNSAFYSGINSCIPAGTITGVHDSYMPLSGIFMLCGMQIDAFFGGLGTGWINFFICLIIALFIGSLMIGRTPELFGKKIEIKEMQWVAIISVCQMLIPLLFAAIAVYTYIHYPGSNGSLGWLSNPGSHGFTTMLYEYVSSYAGNGSGFEGLGDNTVFWNTTTAIVMLAGRFLPIIGAVAIAGSLQKKKYAPPSSGSLKIEGFTFGSFLFALIIIVNALSLFIVYMFGPVTELFLLK